MLVEPGAFRTQFLTSGSKKAPARPMTAAYAGTLVETTLKKFDDMDGKQKGDERESEGKARRVGGHKVICVLSAGAP